jgi:hypothetical protein
VKLKKKIFFFSIKKYFYSLDSFNSSTTAFPLVQPSFAPTPPSVLMFSIPASKNLIHRCNVSMKVQGRAQSKTITTRESGRVEELRAKRSSD